MTTQVIHQMIMERLRTCQVPGAHVTAAYVKPYPQYHEEVQYPAGYVRPKFEKSLMGQETVISIWPTSLPCAETLLEVDHFSSGNS